MDKSRIYIIEENRELLDKITKQINKVQNYQIIGTATHAVDAITFFETNKCDLVIVDLMLSDIDGIGVLEKVNEINKDAYIIISCIGRIYYSIGTYSYNNNFSMFYIWFYYD